MIKLKNLLNEVHQPKEISEMDVNDPVLMKLIAKKDASAKISNQSKTLGQSPVMKSNINRLLKKRAEIMRDMEQEAEPEGGPIADMYGDQLDAIDTAIAKLKGILEVSYEKSGLKNPKLADRDKNKDISSWEKKVGTSIEKNLDEMTAQDEYAIGMKKYSVGRPQQYPDMCQECGSPMLEDMCMECGWESEENDMMQSKDHEVGMAQNLLKDIVSNATQLMNKIGQEEINLPGWVQDHISQAQNYISQANVGYHEL